MYAPSPGQAPGPAAPAPLPNPGLVDDINNLTATMVAVGQALTTILASQPAPAAVASLQDSLQSVRKAVISLERSANLAQMGMQRSPAS